MYYSIKEVSEQLNLPMPTLRYWEQEVRQLQPKTTNGRRYYTPEDIQLIRRLMYLRDQNVPVKDWSHRLTLDERVLDKRAAAMQNLRDIRSQLVELRELI